MSILDTINNFDSSVDILEYFDLSDGIEVTWAHAVNSQKKLKDALASQMMLEADIMFRWNGLPNQVLDDLTKFCNVTKF